MSATRDSLLALLAPPFWLIMCACFLLVATTVIGWPPVGRSAKSKPPRLAENQLPRVIAEEYPRVKDEIRMRLEHEHILFLYQFVLIGAIVLGQSGLFKGGSANNTHRNTLASEYSTIMVGVAAIAVLIVDIHIRYNAMMMETLGDWICKYYEAYLLQPQGAPKDFTSPSVLGPRTGLPEPPEDPEDPNGWELCWKNREHVNFSHGASSIVFAGLYLPTVCILLYYYALFFKRQPASDDELLGFLNKIVFIGVQFAVVLFALIGHWPWTWWLRPPARVCALVCVLSWLVVFCWGCRYLRWPRQRSAGAGFSGGRGCGPT